MARSANIGGDANTLGIYNSICVQRTDVRPVTILALIVSQSRCLWEKSKHVCPIILIRFIEKPSVEKCVVVGSIVESTIARRFIEPDRMAYKAILSIVRASIKVLGEYFSVA